MKKDKMKTDNDTPSKMRELETFELELVSGAGFWEWLENHRPKPQPWVAYPPDVGFIFG